MSGKLTKQSQPRCGCDIIECEVEIGYGISGEKKVEKNSQKARFKTCRPRVRARARARSRAMGGEEIEEKAR